MQLEIQFMVRKLRNRTTKDEKETFYYIVMMILVDIKNQIKTHGDKSIDTNY